MRGSGRWVPTFRKMVVPFSSWTGKTLKIKAPWHFETSWSTYQTTQLHIPEDLNPEVYSCNIFFPFFSFNSMKWYHHRLANTPVKQLSFSLSGKYHCFFWNVACIKYFMYFFLSLVVLQNNSNLPVSDNWDGRDGRFSRQVGPKHTALLRFALALSIKTLCYDHPLFIMTFVEIMVMDFFFLK